MISLHKYLERNGICVVVNRMSSSVDVHFCNSAWFDVLKFEKMSKKRQIVMIHRIDGPVALYRGSDMAEDNKIFDLNARFATATVCQSHWSYNKLLDLGYKPVNPEVIHNAVDCDIFHRIGRIPFSRDRKIRLISTSWSDNPRKGGPFYKWLDSHLDWTRYEYTFVGRVQQSFSHIRHIPAQPSVILADMLRQHDIYITASQKDPCSNALLEALSCGLPALYLNDGGHEELTGHGGLPYSSEEEAILNLERLAGDYETYQSAITVDSMESVAERYMDLARRTALRKVKTV
jgi:glycosyltransferase involved in cell wall biosynthesis